MVCNLIFYAFCNVVAVLYGNALWNLIPNSGGFSNIIYQWNFNDTASIIKNNFEGTVLKTFQSLYNELILL
jgi:hypothetical protein